METTAWLLRQDDFTNSTLLLNDIACDSGYADQTGSLYISIL